MRNRRRSLRGLAALSLCLTSLACSRAALETRAAADDEAFHDVNGVRLFVRTIGTGEPLLLVHGGPGLDHTYFLPGMRGLAGRHQLILYDQRGGGRSSGPVDSASITFENFLEDLDGLRVSLGIDRLDLLAHSFGGLIAIRYALAFPQHVNSLVLMSTVEPGRRFQSETASRQRTRQTTEDSAAIAELVRSDGFRARDTAAVNRLLRTSFRSTFADPRLADRLVIDLDARTARNFGEIPRLLVGPLGAYDYWDRLPEIQAPTLVLHGAEDPIPLEMARELCDRIPRCELSAIPDAGHFPYIEAPETTFSAIDRFLRRQRR